MHEHPPDSRDRRIAGIAGIASIARTARTAATFRRRVVFTLIAVTVVVGGALALWLAIRVLLLGFAGLLLAAFLYKPSQWLSHTTRLPYWAALAAVAVLCLALCIGAFWLMGARIAGQVDALQEQLPKAWARVSDYLQQQRWGRWLLGHAASDLKAQQGSVVLSGLGVLSSASAVLAEFVVVLFVGLFGAINPQLYVRGLMRLIPPVHRPRAREVFQATGDLLWWWLVGQLIAMAFIGVVTALTVWLLGVPLALTLALIAALLNFIPNFGPILSAIPAMMLALLHSPTTAVWVAAAYVVIQLLQNHLVTPLVLQRAANLPPVLLLLGQVLMYAWAGVLGMALAPPLTAVGIKLVEMLYVRDRLGDPMENVQGFWPELAPSREPARAQENG